MLDDRSIALFPRLGTAFAKNIQASHDGKYLAFLWSERGDEHLSLWLLELANGGRRCLLPAEAGYRSIEEMPADIELLRERMRQRYLGVLTYAWFPKASKLLVPRGNELIVVDAETGEHQVAVRAPAAVQAAKISPDGAKVAFACHHDLWLAEGLDRSSIGLRQLTSDGSERLLNGVADFLAQEELSRYDAFWWHPQSEEIVFLQTDLSRVPVVGIPSRRGSETDLHPYSFSGSRIPSWQLAAIRCEDAAISWLPVGEEMRDGYLARAQYDKQGSLFVQVLNREQNRLWLLRSTGADGWTAVLEERSDYWVSVGSSVSFFTDGKSFVWLSTGGDEKQIQIRDVEGGGSRNVPTGDVRVDGIVGVAAEQGTVWFHGRRGAPENRFVFRVSLDGKNGVETLSDAPGWHDAKMLSGKGLWVHSYESISSPPKLEVRNAQGETVVELPGDPRSCAAAVQLPVPEFFDVPGKDGLALRACLYGVRERSSAPLPLLVAVYGGPGVQSVRNAWDVRMDLRSQRFAEAGVLVLKVDNRGSSGRGNSFERQINRSFGTVDVEDQVRGVRYLTDERQLADPKRVAISGWSYGGYLSTMCLLSAGDIFTTAVAGAPVVSWQDYDACYTERYMGRPESEEAAYERADVRTFANGQVRRLLIIHGLRDENVLFVHTAKLAQALNACQADYDLLILPEERHSVIGFENRVLVERRIFDHVMGSFR